MNHKGIEYTVLATATPGIWKWQFRIGDRIRTGRTETRIHLLAIRRVQLQINRELRSLERNAASLIPAHTGHSYSLRDRGPLPARLHQPEPQPADCGQE